MATNVGPQVISEYTAVISVTDDAEVLNGAAFRALVLALANRTEFVLQATALATGVPNIVLHEDNFGAATFTVDSGDASTGWVHGDTLWKYGGSGVTGYGVTGYPNVARNSDQIGGMQLNLNATNQDFAMFKADGPDTLTVKNVDQIERYGAVYGTGPGGTANKTVRFGLMEHLDDSEVGDHGLVFELLPGAAVWSIRSKTAGGETVHPTTVAVSANKEFQLEFVHTDDVTWSCRINNVEVLELVHPTDDVINAEGLNFGAYFKSHSSVQLFLLYYMGLRSKKLVRWTV